MILCRILHVSPSHHCTHWLRQSEISHKKSPSCQVARSPPTQNHSKMFPDDFSHYTTIDVDLASDILCVLWWSIDWECSYTNYAQYPSFAWWIHLVCCIPFQICNKAGRMKWIFLKQISLWKTGSDFLNMMFEAYNFFVQQPLKTTSVFCASNLWRPLKYV